MPSNSFTLSTSVAQAALAYASRGFLIFPLWHVNSTAGTSTPGPYVCHCSEGPRCGSPGKHPRTPRGLPNWGASSNERQVEAWWTMWPLAGIGMCMGANGLAAIDVDPAHGGADTITLIEQHCNQRGVDLFATRHIRTGGGGDHLIFLDRLGVVPTKRQTFGDDAPGVDTRGKGGYVVAPPSLHVSGDRYHVSSNSRSLADWPACLTELLEPARPEAAPFDPLMAGGGRYSHAAGPDGRASAWAHTALVQETSKLAGLASTPEGSGKNDQLNASAYKMGRRVGAGYIDEASVAEALYQAARGWPGHSERELRATIRSGIQAGIRRPHPGPTTRAGGR